MDSNWTVSLAFPIISLTHSLSLSLPYQRLLECALNLFWFSHLTHPVKINFRRRFSLITQTFDRRIAVRMDPWSINWWQSQTNCVFLGFLRAPLIDDRLILVSNCRKNGVDIRDSVRDHLRRSSNGWLESYDVAPLIQASRQGSIQIGLFSNWLKCIEDPNVESGIWNPSWLC